MEKVLPQQLPPSTTPAPAEIAESTIGFKTLGTADWRCDRIADDKSARIYCCPATKAEGWSNSCIESRNAIVFGGREGDVLPPSIKIGENFVVKCGMEKGSKICYFPSELPTKGEIARKLAPKSAALL
jgi:hypothetical protein